MKERLKTAIPLILLVVLAFALPGIYGNIVFLLLAFGMLAFGCHEAYTMADISLKRPLQTCSTIFATLLLLLAMFQHALPFSSLAMAATTLYILACFAILFRETPNQENVVSTFAGMGIFLYLVWSLISVARLYYFNGWEGRLLLVYLIATTKMADVGAYIIGSSTAKMPGGNHKLAPTLSPKKSWEGLIGGTIFSVATALLLLLIPAMTRIGGIKVFSFGSALLFGIIASVAGLLGDLAESALKRAASMKDSGKIPGIGGILDVLDSLIPVAPLFLAYMLLKLS